MSRRCPATSRENSSTPVLAGARGVDHPGAVLVGNRRARMTWRFAVTASVRRYVAEMVGVAILVFFAVGPPVFGIDKIGALGVPLAFGLTLLALAYSIGPVTGCHVNPAVTLGVRIRKGITSREPVGYWISQAP